MKKRRILLALIMLIISGVSLTTATYAWFTANRQVTVEEIDVKASASGGIQISADAEHWSNEVTLDNLRAAELTNNFIPTTALKPVTTIGANTKTGAFDFYLGELDESGNNVTLTSIADNSGNYVAFDLYFYSATPQTIVFNDGTQVVAKNVDTPLEAASDKGLKYSVRVGFLVQGNDATATPETARGLVGGTTATQTIWEPNADVHTDYATNMGNASGIMAYMGGKKEAPAVAMDNSTYFETVTAGTHKLITSTEAAKYPTGTIFNFQGGNTFEAGITKVRVYIWLEGQDIDNEDTASLGTGVGVKLNFKIAD